MVWVFAVQSTIGSMVAALIGLTVGWSASGSAAAAAGLVVLPNLLLYVMLGQVSTGLGPVVLLAGKLAGLLLSILGLVVLSKTWVWFDWFWAMVNLSVVVVVWLSAPLILLGVQRREDHRKIDEIVSRIERSPRD
ncbi:MAG: hypothetical protein RLY30_620 [Pseudomonadota bacterium]|jgi:hypothetical protein